jgi:hypothetical protein
MFDGAWGSAPELSNEGITKMGPLNLPRALIETCVTDMRALAKSPQPSSREERLSAGWRKSPIRLP